MSRTQQRKSTLKCPAIYNIKWSSKERKHELYNKVTKEKKYIDLKGFILLDDDMFQITGYIEPTRQSISSNYARSEFINSDVIRVAKWKDGKAEEVMVGSYAEIKGRLAEMPAYKYTRVVYGLYAGKLAKLSVVGSSLSPWIEFSNGNKSSIFDKSIKCVSSKSETKGVNQFYSPVYEFDYDLSPEEIDIAEDEDRKLRLFVSAIFSGEYATLSEANSAKSEYSQDTNDDNWRDVITPRGNRLGDMTLDELNKNSSIMENIGKTDSYIYKAIIQGIKDLEEEADAMSYTHTEEEDDIPF